MNSKDKLPLKSKKFIALVIGVVFTTTFTSLSLLVIALIPEVSSAVVNLITVSLAAMNGVVGMYALGQSVVDFKINSNHNTSAETSLSIEKKIVEEHKSMEMQYDGEAPIDWKEYEQNYISI
jgi:hypothetical protein